MGATNPMHRGSGRITKGPSQNQLQLTTIEFVYAQLSAWRDDPDRPRGVSENELNSSLCKYLQVQASSLFTMVFFSHQELQGGGRSTDLSASPTQSVAFGGKLYNTYTPFLVFEGKRLPPPRRSREKEYVTGGVDASGKPIFSGGIQRFKLGLHGADQSVAVMLGYIQAKTASDWHTKVNEWIAELAGKKSPDGCKWELKDGLGKLRADNAKSTARSGSMHQRNVTHAGARIRIVRLWVQL